MITLYPAIDLKDGRAVRLVKGDFEQSMVFNEDPVAQARAFAEAGATSLHVVDLDGARTGEPVHAPVVAEIAAAFGGTVHFGGGLRSRAAIETALAAGAERLVVGTALVVDQELLRWAIDRLGDGLVVALDVVRRFAVPAGLVGVGLACSAKGVEPPAHPVGRQPPVSVEQDRQRL